MLLLGPPGTGRTHLTTGLAIRACQAGYRVLFATATEWVTGWPMPDHAGRLHAELRRLGRHPLLVIDEVGHVPVEPEDAKPVLPTRRRPLREHLADRDQQQALRPLERGLRRRGRRRRMIDRLVHHAEVDSLTGDSYRLRDRGLGRTSVTTEDA